MASYALEDFALALSFDSVHKQVMTTLYPLHPWWLSVGSVLATLARLQRHLEVKLYSAYGALSLQWSHIIAGKSGTAAFTSLPNLSLSVLFD